MCPAASLYSHFFCFIFNNNLTILLHQTTPPDPFPAPTPVMDLEEFQGYHGNPLKICACCMQLMSGR